MLTTPTIRQAPSTRDDVFAFRIFGEVSSEDMHAMSEYMNEQFNRHDGVSMLLIFVKYDGAEAGATFDWETIRARIRSIGSVSRYAVVGAPDSAAKLIEGMGKVLPVDARTFDDEDAAWEFVGARPAPEGPGAA